MIDQRKLFLKVINNVNDYYLVSEVDGISYYSDESGGDCEFIVAVSHVDKLAITTNFFDTDDFEMVKVGGNYYPSDYSIVLDNGILTSFHKSSNY